MAAEERTVDMTPSKNAISEIVGGSITFLGQLRNDAVIMIRRDQENPDLRVNQNVLPPPFHRGIEVWPHDEEDENDDETDAEPTYEAVRGTIVIAKMDENATPVDFTLADYNEYLTNPPPIIEEPEDDEEDELVHD